MTSREDAAYAAGLIDSDGWLTSGYAGGRRTDGKPISHWYFRGAVKQVEPQAVEWLRETFGGAVCILKPTGKLSSRPMFLWSITGPGLVTFLDQILPFLKIKRSRAEVVLSYYRGLKHLQKISTAEKAAEISRRTDLHLALRQLNRAA